jgi:hypothetical protein
VRRLFVDHLSQDQLKQLMTDCERVLAVVGGPGDSCCLAEDESAWPRPRGYTAAPGRCRPGTVVFGCGIVSVVGTRGLVCGGMGGTYRNCWRPNLGWYGYEYIKKAGS